MLSEKRRHQRHTINRVAKFETESGALPRECVIIDISEGGARLFAEGVDLPDQFCLLIFGEKVVRRECRVIWRLGGELGVNFVVDQPNPIRQDALERLRTYARRSFGEIQ
jgi:hypothetical protein